MAPGRVGRGRCFECGKKGDAEAGDAENAPDLDGHPGGNLGGIGECVLGVEVEEVRAVTGVDGGESGDDDGGGDEAGGEDAADGQAVIRAIDQDERNGERSGAGGDTDAHREAEANAGEDGFLAHGAPPGGKEEGERPGKILGRDAIDVEDRDEGEGKGGEPPICDAVLQADERKHERGGGAEEGVEEIEAEGAGFPKPRADVLLDGIAGSAGVLVNSCLRDVAGGEGDAPVIGMLAVAGAEERETSEEDGEEEEGKTQRARDGGRAHREL